MKKNDKDMRRAVRALVSASGAVVLAAAPALFLAFGLAGCQANKSRKLIVVEIKSERCDPCKKMGPVLDGLKSEFGGSYEFRSLDATSPEGTLFVRRFQLHVVPTQLVVDDMGMSVYRHDGVITREELAAALRRISAGRRR